VTYADKADADRVMEIQAEEVAKAKEALKKRNGEPGDESQIKAGHVIDDKVVEIKRAEPRSPSGNNKWKGQQGGNHYNQLQQQQLRRQLGVVGGRGYPRSVPYRQLQVRGRGAGLERSDSNIPSIKITNNTHTHTHTHTLARRFAPRPLATTSSGTRV